MIVYGVILTFLGSGCRVEGFGDFECHVGARPPSQLEENRVDQGHQPEMVVTLTWELPKIGDPNIVLSRILGHYKAPKIPLIFGNSPSLRIDSRFRLSV